MHQTIVSSSIQIMKRNTRKRRSIRKSKSTKKVSRTNLNKKKFLQKSYPQPHKLNQNLKPHKID